MVAQAILSRRSFLHCTGAAALASMAGAAAEAQRPNVLFICVDDLRPELACYGKDHMITPNLDKLAARSAVFDNHYVQVPTCGASRCSLLTGYRPRAGWALQNTAFHHLPRSVQEEPVSMPEAFRRAGYHTTSIGKVSHSPNGRRYGKPTGKRDPQGAMLVGEPNDHAPELAQAWDSVGGPVGAWGDPWSAFFAYAGGKTRSYTKDKMPATEAADVPDTGYPDGLIAAEAIKQLRACKDKPFFMGVGFYKPHLPFCAPKQYWDLYDRDTIPLAPHPDPPKGVDPRLSLHASGELTGRYAAMAQPPEATEAEARKLRHGYFASVSYVDAQIGKVLDELEALGLRENTIVVVWGDHGWHLGDLHVWGKHTTFEYSLRSALLIDAPGRTAPGLRTEGVVESLDLYPTLAALCGVDKPGDLDGTNLTAVLQDATQSAKDSAFGYWRRGEHKAKSIRTARYRLTEWQDKHGNVVQVELYDHATDPEESVNVAKEQPEVVEELVKGLHAESPKML